MPVTLPAHAAAILPFTRARALAPVALIVGSTAPDLSYALGWYGGFAHTPAGVLLVAWPTGLAAYLWAELLLLPLLRRRLPVIAGVDPQRLLASRGLPRSLPGWAFVAIAVLLGAITHALWDGCTHIRRWPGQLYADVLVAFGFYRAALPVLFQHLSTIVGSVLALLAWRAAYPRLRPAARVPSRPFLPLLLAVLAGLAVALTLRLLIPVSTGVLGQLWSGFWTSVRYVCLALTLLALFDRVTTRDDAPLPEADYSP